MITILTHSPRWYSKEYIKAQINKALNRTRGPRAVVASLHRGLTELHIEHTIDPSVEKITGTVHVMSGVEALRYAINLKKAGKIKKLIAGPNIVVRPIDAGGILTDPNIDMVLVPSVWVKDFYISQSQNLANKIYVWGAGVEIPALPHALRHDYIVFKKDVPLDLYNHVLTTLATHNIPYRVLTYGQFTQKEFHNALQNAHALMYLQRVESQGLALQEAWAHNVPTLVWNNGTFTFPTGEIITGNIAAPYLTKESGMIFRGISDFEQQMTTFLADLATFKPRAYCIQHLSDKASAEHYLSIIQNQ